MTSNPSIFMLWYCPMFPKYRLLTTGPFQLSLADWPLLSISSPSKNFTKIPVKNQKRINHKDKDNTKRKLWTNDFEKCLDNKMMGEIWWTWVEEIEIQMPTGGEVPTRIDLICLTRPDWFSTCTSIGWTCLLPCTSLRSQGTTLPYPSFRATGAVWRNYATELWIQRQHIQDKVSVGAKSSGVI